MQMAASLPVAAQAVIAEMVLTLQACAGSVYIYISCLVCRLTSDVIAPTILLDGTVTLHIRAPLRQLPKRILASLYLLRPLIPLLLSTRPVLIFLARLAGVIRAFVDSAEPRVAMGAGEHVTDFARIMDLARGAALGCTPAEVRFQAEYTACLECVVSVEHLFGGVGLDLFMLEGDFAGRAGAFNFLPAVAFEL